MDDQSVDQAGSAVADPICFIGSILDGPGHGLIVLRGDLCAAEVGRLREHIDAFLAGPTRYLMLDGRAVERYHPDLLDLLGHTQCRLADRRGMLQVRGLHPTRLADPVPAEPYGVEFAPAPDPTAPVSAGATTSREGERRGCPHGAVLTSGPVLTGSGRHRHSPDPNDATSPGEPGSHDMDTTPA